MARKKEEKKQEEKVQEAKELSKDEVIAELTDMLKRTQAEFINYKNRVEKENKEAYEYCSADLVKKLLPVLDSFELAFKNTGEAGKFRQGMEMVYAQLVDVLEHEGLRRIDAEGKKFDPYRHEVLMKDKSDKSPDIVLEEFQKGYMFKNKVARHSKVKVSE
ncbi:TPA: nucleotide exchange factor GrpE [Candidatus Woesearchaeota archaeon]|nr:Protein GrpE [archaeon GW2011_AR15]MBS3104150.1 nucleotide exchange factor GrpE [Candidatus Woesearchaeota archaeon]HIH41430.1 nucleotide exchange factor GrpE [Candidatus Woesearchaeota archaeon]